ncbi:hypothetical protein UFOVP116_203 [uncultured Caudovirales phage]|uniref:Uncharacterized protein n=1 Tax=uncultured Caudovirales phage TaxID=2100421 RepID=A0A6J5LA64_9CAUD|nr:hypothetical protein UFOVP116_203 [uncultured Caudovirales phage]
MISTKVQDLVLTAISMEQRKVRSLDAYFKHNQLYVTDASSINKVRKMLKQLNINIEVVSTEEEVHA